MASVTSLDADMRNLRLARYTPAAAAQTRAWLESTLGTPLPAGDLLDALKDGIALCQLANLVLPSPGLKYKTSSMPFIQMENISHFLRACEMAPLNLPAHDRFLTVDLFESKDPAQVLQCLGAFSRRACVLRPERFRETLGGKKTGVVSPSSTGGAMNGGASWRSSAYGRPASPTKSSAAMPSSARAMSPALTGGSTGSQGSNPARSPGPVSSWSSKKDESGTAPAWNIHQYGYMGGASQGNQGISFGARRQITSQAPTTGPGLAEKQRARQLKADEEERVKVLAEEAEHRRKTEREAEEERDRVEEERRWEEQTRRVREEEKQRVEAQKRQWEEQERKWKMEEEARRKEEERALPPKSRVPSSGLLRGQTLSQYQRELARSTDGSVEEKTTPEQRRVRELEKQLEEARERERVYQVEREERVKGSTGQAQPVSRPQSARESEASWAGDERESLRQAWQQSKATTPVKPVSSAQGRALPAQPPPSQQTPPRPTITEPQAPEQEPEHHHEEEVEEEQDLPTTHTPCPQIQQSDSLTSLPSAFGNPESAPTSSPLGSSNRPLPTPLGEREYEAYSPDQPRQQGSRVSSYLSAHPAPQTPQPRVSSSKEAGDTALEHSQLRDRRLHAQGAQTTKAGAWASKSLLEREMERERERQREWEDSQREAASKPRDKREGVGEGQSWDVNQYGYTGGDGQGGVRGSSAGSGIAMGGRRQIIGPRPQGPR